MSNGLPRTHLPVDPSARPPPAARLHHPPRPHRRPRPRLCREPSAHPGAGAPRLRQRVGGHPPFPFRAGRTCRARSRSTARPRRSPRRSPSGRRSCRSSSTIPCASPRRSRCSTTSRAAGCSSGSARACPRPAITSSPDGAHERDNDYLSKVEQLHWALRGEQVPDSQARIHPPNHDLRGRIYHGTSTWSTIRRAAQLGDGFILERFGNGDERTPENRPAFLKRQSDSILEYRSEFARSWGTARTPHVVLSRSAWPAESTEQALRRGDRRDPRVERGFARSVGRLPEGLTPAEELVSDNVAWGTVDDLVADLTADPSFALSDELVLGLHPGRYTLPLAIEKARILIERAYPLLDAEWRRARSTLDDRVAAHDASRPDPRLPPDRRHPRERNDMTLATSVDALARRPAHRAERARWRAVASEHGIASLRHTHWLDDEFRAYAGAPGRWAGRDGRVVGRGLSHRAGAGCRARARTGEEAPFGRLRCGRSTATARWRCGCSTPTPRRGSGCAASTRSRTTTRGCSPARSFPRRRARRASSAASTATSASSPRSEPSR